MVQHASDIVQLETVNTDTTAEPQRTFRVPPELAELKQWLLWRYKDGRKIPYQPGGQCAKSNDPTTWNTLEQCYWSAGGFEGLAFVFAADDPFCGIDLDGAFGDDGELTPWAADILAKCPSYAEVSPSGTGIKLWIRGKLPGTGRRHTISTTEQIEIYDRGRYFTFTGNVLDAERRDVVDCQAALDSIMAQYFPAKPAVETKPVTHYSTSTTSTDAVRRATAYVDRIPPVESGQNRGTATLKVAGALVRGFGLSKDQAFPILWNWNAKCSPNDRPEDWLTGELNRKLNDADKHPGDRGWLLNSKRDDYSDVDLSQFKIGGAEPAVPAAADQEHAGTEVVEYEPPEPNDDAQDSDSVPDRVPEKLLKPAGFLSDVIEYTLATSRYPQPEIALAGAIALMSVLTGRKVCDEGDGRTNTYILSVNPPRSGKEQSRKTNKKIMSAAGALSMLGNERLGSHAGLITKMYRGKSVLFQLDEIGHLLAVCRDAKVGHLYQIISVLLTLYSASSDTPWTPDAYADDQKTKEIDQPHCVLFGTTTNDGLWENMSRKNVTDGLMGRLLIFEGRGYVDYNEDFRSLPVPDGIVATAKRWVDLVAGGGNLSDEHPVPYVIPTDPDAKAMYHEHVRGINNRRKTENAFRAAIWSGTHEKTAKLAMIHACSRAYGVPDSITVEDMEWGKQLAIYQTRRMLAGCGESLAENENHAKYQKILKVVGRQKLSKRNFHKSLRWLPAWERDKLVESLVADNDLAIEAVKTTGRPKEVYYRPCYHKV